MEVKVDLSPEQINKTIAEAIAKSAIGVQLDRIIKEKVEQLSTSYQNPIAPVVSQHIEATIRTVVQEKYGEQIKTWVKVKVTEQFTEELFNKMWEAFTRKY